MTTHGSAAKAARERKEKHPELYCPVGRCLWRTGGGRCPKHPASIAVELAEMEARNPRLRELGERIESVGRAIAAKQAKDVCADDNPEHRGCANCQGGDECPKP